jgi:hypothetical protein
MIARTDGLVDLRFDVNGQPCDVSVAPDRVLLDVLRDELGLTGTKEGCSVGVCGLCSLLVDGALLTACLLPAVKVDGRSVTTIEGIAGPDGALSGPGGVRPPRRLPVRDLHPRPGRRRDRAPGRGSATDRGPRP